MPPPAEAPFWILHGGGVVPRRPRRLLREQDETITSDQLTAHINAVPNRPTQTPTDVKLILQTLQWTILPDGETQKRKRWKPITNNLDANTRAFGYKGFLPTMARKRYWWYPGVFTAVWSWIDRWASMIP